MDDIIKTLIELVGDGWSSMAGAIDLVCLERRAVQGDDDRYATHGAWS